MNAGLDLIRCTAQALSAKSVSAGSSLVSPKAAGCSVFDIPVDPKAFALHHRDLALTYIPLRLPLAFGGLRQDCEEKPTVQQQHHFAAMLWRP